MVFNLKKTHETIFQWAVVGAGPAGIAAVGTLLDQGIEPNSILWVDPHFKVGDLGQLWANVSSNTSVKYFTLFLHAVSSFLYHEIEDRCLMNALNPEDTCALSYVVEPLQWITDRLVCRVTSVQTIIHSLKLEERLWTLCSGDKSFKARNVILATGSLPSILNHPDVDVIPFDAAIDKEKLSLIMNPEETYAVFGSSHSAMIINRHLVELGAKKIINFYRSPCRYAVDMGDWILFDNTGLKGQTAEWTRTNIDGVLPANLFRYTASESNIARYLPECNKAIYAVGFQRRKNLVIGDYEDVEYNPYVGIIGPGLFGFGIAYPELKQDPFGGIESQVGLWKFMAYLNKVMPVWLRYPT